MDSVQMQILTPYEVTKASSDGTLCVGDLVWISENGDLNIADPKSPGWGWLDSADWHSPLTVDFEVKSADEYKVLHLVDGREVLCEKKSLI